jgi:hypothetical protein
MGMPDGEPEAKPEGKPTGVEEVPDGKTGAV